MKAGESTARQAGPATRCVDEEVTIAIAKENADRKADVFRRGERSYVTWSLPAVSPRTDANVMLTAASPFAKRKVAKNQQNYP